MQAKAGMVFKKAVSSHISAKYKSHPAHIAFVSNAAVTERAGFFSRERSSSPSTENPSRSWACAGISPA
jgi:hypothetical protein